MMVRRSTGQARALRSTYRNVIWTEPSTPSPDSRVNPSPPLSEQRRHPHRSVADVFHRRRGRSGDSRPGADAGPAGNTLARPLVRERSARSNAAAVTCRTEYRANSSALPSSQTERPTETDPEYTPLPGPPPRRETAAAGNGAMRSLSARCK